MDSLIRSVLDNDYATLKSYVEQKVADGINKRITDKKIDILSSMNGISREKQMEVMAIS